MRTIFPLLKSLKGYNRKALGKDLLSGFTVGIVLIPQGLAYALIAGLPPVYGLYASVFPVLVYMFLGTSKPLSVGPVAMDSLLVAVGLGALGIIGLENYIAMAMVLAFMVGAIQFLLGVLRMGYLVNFLSKPVISGFTSAAAVIIIFSQLKHLFGLSMEGSNKFHLLVLNFFTAIESINWVTLGVGAIGIFLLIGFKKWSKKIPGILLVVVLGTLFAYFLRLESYGLDVVGAVPKGLPGFHWPSLSSENFIKLWPIALALSLIGFLEAISIAKGFEERSEEDNLDANRELMALGSANLLGSLFQSYPVSASFSRSAIKEDSGMQTNLSSGFSALLVVLTLLFLTPLFYYLPKSILASIIVVSVFKLIDVDYPRRLWKYRRDEFVVLILTFLITIFVGIPQGILVGVLASLLLMVYRTSKPHFPELGTIRGTDYYKNINRFGDEVIIREDLLIVRFDSQLYFANANYFKKELNRYIEQKGPSLKGVILNAEAINYIDSTATRMLVKTITQIQQKGIQFHIVGAIGPTRDIIFRSDIAKVLPKEFLFVKIKEAVAYFDKLEDRTDSYGKVAHQRNKGGN
ncbi:MAG: sulfate permease [Eudoraea sp.]|uniref:SulP family inorganic anion transporter n=1 Tax=Eudoraea sp. TaxID=1979955 RepID=UPI003C744607